MNHRSAPTKTAASAPAALPARRGRPRRVAAATALIALTLVLAACSGSSDTDSTAKTTTTASSATGGTAAHSELGDTSGTDPLPALPEDLTLPLVFVHGFAGSAQQYESQAMRFVANGYPQDRIVAYEQDGAGFDIDGYAEGLATFIDDTLATFGTDQVYLVGHSRGTSVSTKYLTDPAHAAKVAKYIAIDGAPCPDGVECYAPMQKDFPGQTHVEVATSKESFAKQYEFLLAQEPEVTDIVAQRDPIEISGRAVNFPANTGREGTLDIWAIDAGTGARTGDGPTASFDLGTNGDFGPVELETGGHYEYAISSDDTPVVHHLYLQPYLRSSNLVRLLSSPPDGPTRTNTNTSEDHSALIIMRMREWHAEGDADVLNIRTGGSDPVNAVTDFVGNGTIGLHVHDDKATPKKTTLARLPYFSEQPFQSGIDIYLPATDDAAGTITIENLPRGDASDPQTINVPNWPSATNAVSIVFTDWPVDAPS